MFEFKAVENGEQLDVTLKGRLDATQAPALMEEMKNHVGKPITRIVFHAAELEYIASAGIRVIIFTKQKIGQQAEVVLEKPTNNVVSVMEMTGVGKFITIES